MTEALTDSTFPTDPTDVITPQVRKAVLDLVRDYLDKIGATVDVNQYRPIKPVIRDGETAGFEPDGYMTLTVHIRVPQLKRSL